jgi:molybdopterin converting factor small subunit
VIYDGTTYRKADPDTTITYKVNGQQVVPGGYVLKDGDEIRIIIDTANGS